MSSLIEETLRFLRPRGVEMKYGNVLMKTGFTARPILILFIILAPPNTSFFSFRCKEIFRQ